MLAAGSAATRAAVFSRSASAADWEVKGALQIRIGRPWRATRVRAPEGRTTLPAELVAGGVLLLAPGTLHSEPSQRAGPGAGRIGAPSLVWRGGGAKGHAGGERPAPRPLGDSERWTCSAPAAV